MEHREIVITGVTPSQNELDGKHWTVKNSVKKEWYGAVLATIGRLQPKETRKAKVEIRRVSKRLIDDLNVPAGCKWLLDALVSFGWLVDDSVKWCRVSTDQRKCEADEEPHMEISITYEA